MASQIGQKPKVLITGSNGFVGSAIRFLHSQLDDPTFTIVGADKDDFDIRDMVAVDAFVRHVSPDYAIHLAAVHFIPYCNDNPTETYEINVLGTQNVLSALSRTVCKRVFIASSGAVYTPSKRPHKETDATWPIDIYGFTKRVAELHAMGFAKRIGMEVVIGRYFNMYGHGETTPHLIPTIMRQALEGNEIHLGNVDTLRDYTHVTDNAAATIHALFGPIMDEGCPWQIVNLGSGQCFNALDLIELVGRALSKKLFYVPRRDKMRKSDRPVLVANVTKSYRLGFTAPQVPIYKGLSGLQRVGLGPHVNWDLE